MSVQTEKFIRKVRPVEAVKVTEDNLSALAGWCGGLVVPAGTIGDVKATYIHVPVRNPRRDSDSQAFVGMWIIKEDFRNCRVVTNKQFRNSYDPLEKPKPAAPKPSGMPQKKEIDRGPEPKKVGAVEVVPGTPADEGSSLTTGTKEDQEVHRSAESGEFVTEEFAEANPDTTVTETIDDGLTDDERAEYAALEAEEKKEENVNSSNSFNHDELSREIEQSADGAQPEDELVDVVPGDMVDPAQPEEDEDGTVQLGAPLESPETINATGDVPELCGQCGSQVVDGVCSKDIEHDIFGQAVNEASAPRILPGD